MGAVVLAGSVLQGLPVMAGETASRFARLIAQEWSAVPMDVVAPAVSVMLKRPA